MGLSQKFFEALAFIPALRGAESKRAEQRHGEEESFGEDAIGVVDPDGDELYGRLSFGEVGKAGFEGLEFFPGATSAFGEED